MHSMTGFGRSEGKVVSYFFTVEVKSVNHRYLDARFRIPQALSQFELPMNEILRKECERGSFDVSIRQRVAASDTHYKGTTKFVVDETALKSFIEGAKWLQKTHKIEKSISLDSLVQTNRVFVAVDETEDVSKIWDGLKGIYQKALKDLKTMRKAEGEKLKQILLGGALEIERLAEKLEELAADHPKRVEEKLQQRIKKWELGGQVDKGRLETEIAFLAERADITEEIDRLRAHGKEFGKLLEGSEKSIGRKLEFLTQELLREANTVASKADMLEVTQLSLTLKSKIEKLREQVQNVE